MQKEEDFAKNVMTTYIDVVEKNCQNISYHLSENVVLDWFGKTVKDAKKVAFFLRGEMAQVTHLITQVQVSENVAFRNSHNVKIPKDSLQITASTLILPLDDPSRTISTPSTSATVEMGQGDGRHNSTASPPTPKKMKFSSAIINYNNNDISTVISSSSSSGAANNRISTDRSETIEGEVESPKLKYTTAEGSVEFHKASVKKYQVETKWQRPMKLHLGYTRNGGDFTICLIVYEGAVKCRRNLFKQFCKSEESSSPEK